MSEAWFQATCVMVVGAALTGLIAGTGARLRGDDDPGTAIIIGAMLWPLWWVAAAILVGLILPIHVLSKLLATAIERAACKSLQGTDHD